MGMDLPSSFISFKIIVKSGASFSNEKVGFMIRKDSGNTAEWTPYMNVCPISGWTGANIYCTDKSIVNFTVNTFTNQNQSQYNGNVGWCDNLYHLSAYAGKTVTYSVDIDATNATSDNNAARIWAKDKEGNWKYLATTGTYINAGTSGRSSISVAITDDIDWIVFGLWLQTNATASNPMVELSSMATEYKDYEGITIPVTFPITKNLFPSALPSSAITASISNNVITQATYSKLFAISCDANTDYVCSNAVRFGWSVGFLNKLPELGDTIDYKGSMTNRDSFKVNSGNNTYMIITVPQESIFETLSTYRPQIEKGSAATSYEPYKTCYGGYVDLINGKLVMEWGLYRLPLLTSINVSMDQYIKADACDGWVIPSPAIINAGNPQMLTYTPLSNKLKFDKSSIWATSNKVNCFTINSNQLHMNIDNKLLGITDYTQETRASAATKLMNYFNTEYNNGNYFEFAYKLATPIEYSLTATQLKTLLGTNNIWSNTNGNTTVTYWTH